MYYNRGYVLYVSVISYFFKIIPKNQIVYLHLHAYADDDTLPVLAFKEILVYFQHTFL